MHKEQGAVKLTRSSERVGWQNDSEMGRFEGKSEGRFELNKGRFEKIIRKI